MRIGRGTGRGGLPRAGGGAVQAWRHTGGGANVRKSMRVKAKEARRCIPAEILLALEYIHILFVVYRGLKLENVLLDLDGHVRIAEPTWASASC